LPLLVWKQSRVLSLPTIFAYYFQFKAVTTYYFLVYVIPRRCRYRSKGISSVGVPATGYKVCINNITTLCTNINTHYSSQPALKHPNTSNKANNPISYIYTNMPNQYPQYWPQFFTATILNWQPFAIVGMEAKPCA
jgi:hypothetical protein